MHLVQLPVATNLVLTDVGLAIGRPSRQGPQSTLGKRPLESASGVPGLGKESAPSSILRSHHRSQQKKLVEQGSSPMQQHLPHAVVTFHLAQHMELSQLLFLLHSLCDEVTGRKHADSLL